MLVGVNDSVSQVGSLKGVKRQGNAVFGTKSKVYSSVTKTGLAGLHGAPQINSANFLEKTRLFAENSRQAIDKMGIKDLYDSEADDSEGSDEEETLEFCLLYTSPSPRD